METAALTAVDAAAAVRRAIAARERFGAWHPNAHAGTLPRALVAVFFGVRARYVRFAVARLTASSRSAAGR